MRGSNAAIALLMLGGLPGVCAAEPARRISYGTELRANVANTERYVADGVCERRGVRQMAEILQRAEFEEMWAFLPRAHDTGGCAGVLRVRQRLLPAGAGRRTARPALGHGPGVLDAESERRPFHDGRDLALLPEP